MRARSRNPVVIGSILLVVTLAGCSEELRPSRATAPGNGLPRGAAPIELDPADFTTEIDNPYWPMEVGTRWTYREIDEDGKTVEVVVVATSETKELANGITARV